MGTPLKSMKYSEALVAGLLACAPLLACSAEATPSADGTRFAAISRPAIAVKAPARTVLIAGTALADGRLVCVGERGVVVLSDDGGATWRQAASVPTSITLTAITVAPTGDIFAVGHGGVILKSADRGERWRMVVDGRGLAAEAVASARASQAQGGVESGRAQQDAEQLLRDGPDKPLMAIAFQDARRGIVVGAYNMAFVTEDGGATWRSAMNRLDNPKALHLYAVAIQGSTWMIAGEQGTLLRSLDGGQTFARLNSPYAGSWFALTSGGAGKWYLAGLRGHVHFSEDDGQTWAEIEGGPPSSFVAATFEADGHVLLANQSGLLFSAQGKAPMKPVSKQAVPQLTQAIALKGGGIVALGYAGATKIQGAGL